MSDQQTISSPCIGVCALNEEDECIACGRNVIEIGEWGVMDTAERRAVLDRIERKQKGLLE